MELLLVWALGALVILDFALTFQKLNRIIELLEQNATAGGQHGGAGTVRHGDS